jgi:hypothetical protein
MVTENISDPRKKLNPGIQHLAYSLYCLRYHASSLSKWGKQFEQTLGLQMMIRITSGNACQELSSSLLYKILKIIKYKTILGVVLYGIKCDFSC